MSQPGSHWRARWDRARRGFMRAVDAGRGVWRRAPRSARVATVGGVALVVLSVAAVAVWAEVTAALLDLDAVQETPLVLASGQPLRAGVTIQAVGASLGRLRYREVSTAPAQAGEYRRTRDRWEIHLRAREDVPRRAA